MHSHHLGVNPTTFDPRFSGFPVDPSMVFKQEDADAAQMQGQPGMYAQDSASRGGLNHSRGHHGYTG